LNRKFSSDQNPPILSYVATGAPNYVSQIAQQVGVAFSRNAKRVVVFLAGFAIIAFAVGSELLLRTQAQRALNLRIATFRAALALRDDADLAESVARLQSCTDGLVAAATLTEEGTLSKVYPADQHHIELATMALANTGTTIYVPATSNGASVPILGALVDLPRNDPSSHSRALLLIRRIPYRMAWFNTLLLVTAGVSGMAVLRFYTLNRWFERQVVAPLRAFARLNIDPQAALTQLPSLEAGVWVETAQIAKQFEALLHSLNESDARVRRLEQESRRQILHKEVGFDLKLKRAKDEATIDALTKLRNRAFLECDLEPLFVRQQEKGSSLSAVMMDVDNFKRYNDTHGHQAGDSLLRFIGSLLRGGIRPIDYAVRYGGDEFLLLLPDVNADEAAIVANRLIKLFAQYAGQLSRDCGVSMSAGVACVADGGCANGHLLLKSADAALYSAKRGGKNTVSISDGRKSVVAPAFPKPANASLSH
jgi:diguanylate cyclase (GGDEF)-like protein